MTETDTLLEVKGLTKHFALHADIYSKLAGKKAQVLKAVDGVDFQIRRGETLGLVGESGCGKSTTARLVAQTSAGFEPTSGQVRLRDEDHLSSSSVAHEGDTQGDPDRLPGSLQLAEFAQDDHAHPEPTDGRPTILPGPGPKSAVGCWSCCVVSGWA